MPEDRLPIELQPAGTQPTTPSDIANEHAKRFTKTEGQQLQALHQVRRRLYHLDWKIVFCCFLIMLITQKDILYMLLFFNYCSML